MVLTSTWLVTHSESPDTSQLGGKGTGLFHLQSLGLNVPPFVVLSVDAFLAACPDGIVPVQLPETVEQVLNDAWNKLEAGSISLAVRSSAVDEDGQEASFAGQMETTLNVTTRLALSQAVLHCWRSLYSARAITYRNQHQKITQPRMAVVIQQMIQPTSSGVLFTVNPVNQNPEEVMISAVWGLGEGLVSGVLDADTYITNQDGSLLSQEIAEKKEQIISTPTGGIQTVRVSDNLQHQPALSESILKQLVQYSAQAEQAAGYPLDIEFAVYDETIYFLQARPITSLKTSPKNPNHSHQNAKSYRQVWDNSNINESYPGITLPLTFSFIRKAYYCVYWQFLEVLGIPEPTIRQHETMLANMLGLIQGRVYYNLLNWYRLVSLMPGFEFNKGFMEAMMGLQTPDNIEPIKLTFLQKYVIELPSLLRVGCNMLWLQWTLEVRIQAFHQKFKSVYDQLNPIDYEKSEPSECLSHFERLEQEVLWFWKAPIINDFSAMIYYGILKKLTLQWKLDPDGSLQNALICGQGDIESTQVMNRLLDIARAIAADSEFKAQFLSQQSNEALKLLNTHVTLGKQFQIYLATYGDRCVAELKLESISMKDNPTFCIAMLQNYLQKPIPDASHRQAHESDVRREADQLLRQRLWKHFGFTALFYEGIYRWILFRSRSAIRNRENQRLARTRAFALVRRMFRSIGQWFYQHDILEKPDDIFYLEVEEIRGFVRGTSSTSSLKTLVKLRQKEFAHYQSLAPLPDHFVTHGPVGSNTVFEEESTQAQDSNSTDILKGLGACPGILEKKAIVLFEPDTTLKLDGEILVTRQTDPGWVVLFPSISGLVVERGSMLSHSAIVAREMGIPAVVGVKGATQKIKTGDFIRLDGGKGSVEIINKKAEE